MKFCPQCGQPGGDEQKFCMKCGTDISVAPITAAPYYPPSVPAKTNTKTIVLVIAGVALFLAIPVILIIAAIAIPNLIRARISANEASAAASVRTITTAAIQYQAQYGQYPQRLEQLGPPPTGTAPDEVYAGLIDNVLASHTKQGYVFSYRVYLNDKGEIDSFAVNADPAQPGQTGRRHFFSNQDGLIRMDPARTATAESPPLY